jgi:hypothetical protein
MSRTQTVTFNVGGEKFQVARSLLDFYPDSVLAKSISERWKQPDQDANEEIFFDRSPQLFCQVLEYLRNKKVHLPITMAKKAILCELEYYCVNDVEEEAIDDSLTRGIQLLQSMKDVATHMQDFDGEVSRLENEREQRQESVNAIKAAKALLNTFRDNPTNQECILCKDLIKDCRLTDSILMKCNEYLSRVGLKVQRNGHSNFVNLFELNKPSAFPSA